MANMDNPFQPAIDALETELVEVERNANALLTTINLLRSKAGMPPREPMLRKNTVMFHKMPNGSYGLTSWYPNARRPKEGQPSENGGEATTSETEDETEDNKAATNGNVGRRLKSSRYARQHSPKEPRGAQPRRERRSAMWHMARTLSGNR